MRGLHQTNSRRKKPTGVSIFSGRRAFVPPVGKPLTEQRFCMQSRADTFRFLLEAAAFAARAHDGQKRKDKETPYVSHVFRVCLVVREVFGFTDLSMLMTALLHDTIED